MLTSHVLRGRRILIVEDEPLVAIDIEEALRSAGAEVIGIGATVEKAMTLADTPNLHGAIIDLRLHGRSVRDVVQRLAERRTPCVLYTGAEGAQTASNWPAAPIVVKPARMEHLLDVLSRTIEKAG